MKRPAHGFKRVANNLSAQYICTCGTDNCWQADETWMDWAQAEIAVLSADNERLRDYIKTLKGSDVK
jgi:hypothetical protein